MLVRELRRGGLDVGPHPRSERPLRSVVSERPSLETSGRYPSSTALTRTHPEGLLSSQFSPFAALTANAEDVFSTAVAAYHDLSENGVSRGRLRVAARRGLVAVIDSCYTDSTGVAQAVSSGADEVSMVIYTFDHLRSLFHNAPGALWAQLWEVVPGHPREWPEVSGATGRSDFRTARLVMWTIAWVENGRT